MHWKKPRALTFVPAVVLLVGLGGVCSALRLSHNPAFCSRVCHVMTPYYETYNSATDDFLAHRHAQSGIVCKDCHPTNLLLQAKEVFITVSGQYDVPLRERVFVAEECFACHAHDSYESVAALTQQPEHANPHDSHWGEMECRLCHRVHYPSTDYCIQCHDYGFEVP